ncbi:MAG: hypothetical protein GTN71_20065, partial [Anaerolineae bacterium]|nr:hypothetical protein [Anaerolineae bacterium]
LFFPAWNGTYLIVGCVLVALEANYSYRLIRARQLRGTDVLRFRAVEMAMFFILLKIGGYVGDSWADVLADVHPNLAAPAVEHPGPRDDGCFHPGLLILVGFHPDST